MAWMSFILYCTRHKKQPYSQTSVNITPLLQRLLCLLGFSFFITKKIQKYFNMYASKKNNSSEFVEELKIACRTSSFAFVHAQLNIYPYHPNYQTTTYSFPIQVSIPTSLFASTDSSSFSLRCKERTLLFSLSPSFSRLLFNSRHHIMIITIIVRGHIFKEYI